MFCFLVPSVTVAVSAHVTQWLAHCNPHSNHRIRCSAVEKCELFLIPSAPRRRHRDKTWICAISDLISQRETLFFSSSPLAERPRRHPASHTMCTRIRGREANTHVNLTLTLRKLDTTFPFPPPRTFPVVRLMKHRDKFVFTTRPSISYLIYFS